MTRSRSIIAPVLLALAFLIAPTPAGPVGAVAADPTVCDRAGWVFLDWQAWWNDPGEPWPGRHSHVGACWPVNDLAVDGLTTFNIRVQTHAQPPGASVERIRLKDYCSGSSCAVGRRSSGSDVWSAPGPLPQPDANGNLVADFSVTLDLRTAATGRHEFRWGVYVLQPSSSPGADSCFDSGAICQLISSRAEIAIRDDSPAYRTGDWQGAGGWYQDVGYSDARQHGPIPTGPVASWSPTVQCTDPSGDPTTSFVAALDQNAHAGDRGTILWSASAAGTKTLPPITTPGSHRLAIVCGAQTSSGLNGGVLVVPFTIAGAPAPTGTPIVTPPPTPVPTPVPTPTLLPTPSGC